MDFAQLQGLLSAQPDEAEKRMALSQGLLGLGVGLLSGSRGNYGAFAPALAQGLQGGMQGFMGAQQLGQQNRRAKAQEAMALAGLQSQMSGNRIREQEAAERAQERQRQQTWRDSVARATAPPAPMPMPVAGSMGGLDSYDPPNAAPTPAPRLTPELLQTLGIQGMGMGGENLLAEAARLRSEEARMRAENRPQMMVTERTNPQTGQRERVAVPVMPGQETVLGDMPREQGQIISTNQGMMERMPDGSMRPARGPDGRVLQPYRAPTQGPAPQLVPMPDPSSPTGFRFVPMTSGGVAPAPASDNKPPTEGQGKAVLFGARMLSSHNTLGQLEAQGVTQPSLLVRGARALPLVGNLAGMAANATVASPQQQQVEQAQRDFINAVLRRESGAVIADSEFANAAQQYFPQPGDSPQVMDQKRRNREAAIEGISVEAGGRFTPEIARIGGGQPQRQPIGSGPDLSRNIGGRDAVLQKYGLK